MTGLPATLDAHAAMASAPTIADLQAAFRIALGKVAPPEADFLPTGEIDGNGPYRVYKFHADGPWCFKSETPITSMGSAAAVAVYLNGLARLAPDFANRPPLSVASSAQQNAPVRSVL